ncbi:MAG TPA: hypothetical protein VM943_02295 [Pyrinomonadaceae bacterium]|nr:hypothetical protein [Pyrinomonadaceae bacterium]
MYYAARTILFLMLLFGCAGISFSQEENGAGARRDAVNGSLAEVRDKRRVLLLTGRSNTVDVRDAAKTALEAADRMAANGRSRHHLSYFIIAQKLNKYIRKYKSMAAVEDTAEAEFIIVFNVLEMRRSLGSIYPYGELFVISNDRETGQPSRILWQTEKNLVWAEEAAGQLIKALKATRGEK